MRWEMAYEGDVVRVPPHDREAHEKVAGYVEGFGTEESCTYLSSNGDIDDLSLETLDKLGSLVVEELSYVS